MDGTGTETINHRLFRHLSGEDGKQAELWTLLPTLFNETEAGCSEGGRVYEYQLKRSLKLQCRVKLRRVEELQE